MSRSGATLAVAVPTGMLAAHGWLYGRWIVDDAAITFAYARSIASGLGPVLQRGADPVEGYSNPAWLGLLVAGRWLGLFDHGSWLGVPDVVAYPKLLGLLSAVGVFVCFHLTARALTSRPALVTIGAGTALACTPSFAIWTFSGLENGLLAFAVAGLAAVVAHAAAGCRLHCLGPAVACGLFAALASLTRPDGVIYAGVYPLVVLVLLRAGQFSRAAAAVAVSTVAFAVPTGLYLGWRISTFGEFLPNTALAKSQGLPDLDSLHRPVELVSYLGWPAVLIATGMVALALARPWPGRAGLVALSVPLVLAIAAFAVLNADWMGEYRFATPVWTLATLTSAVASARVLPTLAVPSRTVVAALAVAAAAVSSGTLIDAARAFRTAPTAPLCLVAANTGDNIAGYARIVGAARATVLAPDVGGAALVSPVRIVDLAGLTDAAMAGFWHRQDWGGLRNHVFDEVRPTFIKSHGGWSTITGLVTDPRLTNRYAEIGSTGGSTDWVRRDLVGELRLAQLRSYHREVAEPRDLAMRQMPRCFCALPSHA
ncbi:hypothetical protein [Pseudonocardia spinosispora]|uniref:hypothetical protein n=1 Tax=Pseudonocardia spinosispora TaxID=103441 RepID=UPI0004066FCE|nr:hypothetical protein [Pseudonocardia spinosispora]